MNILDIINYSMVEAKGDVKIFDKIKNIMVESEKVLYFKNEDKFSTKGKTKANIEDKYFINTRDLTLLRKNMLLSSQYKTTIADTLNNFYTLNDFSYLINEEILKGKEIAQKLYALQKSLSILSNASEEAKFFR